MIPPLFILAPGRSFTSLTCAMIGCHPEAFGLAEVNLFAADTIAELQERRSRLASGLMRSLSQLAFGEQSEESVQAVRRWLLDNPGLSTGELFRTMQEWADDKVLIDKSPLHVYTRGSLHRIGTAIPEARYLHLTRHPADTIKSVFQLQRKIRERFGGADFHTPRTNRAPDTFWLDPHLRILEFLETIPIERQMRLRGEDLLSDPPNYLRQIAEWLGLRTDDEAIEAMLHPENSPFANYGPKGARFGNDPNFLESPQLRPFHYTPSPLEWTKPDGTTQDLSEVIRVYSMVLGY